MNLRTKCYKVVSDFSFANDLSFLRQSDTVTFSTGYICARFTTLNSVFVSVNWSASGMFLQIWKLFFALWFSFDVRKLTCSVIGFRFIIASPTFKQTLCRPFWRLECVPFHIFLRLTPKLGVEVTQNMRNSNHFLDPSYYYTVQSRYRRWQFSARRFFDTFLSAFFFF